MVNFMRPEQMIFRRYQTILSYTGRVYLLVSLLMLTPLMVLLVWPAERAYSVGFILPAILFGVFGLVLWKGCAPKIPPALTVQDGGVIVVLSWTITMIVSALPFMLISRLNFTQALFEAVSGWTTTGLSVVDVTHAPKTILFWRSLMHFAGGAGFAIGMLSAIGGQGETGLSVAEGRADLLAQHVRQATRLVLMLYACYVLVGIVSYGVCGMTWFDAINHALAAVSTGGFSTHAESIGYWNSVSIEIVTMVLMLFGNFNFLTAYILLQGKFKAFSRNGEVRLMALSIPLSAVLVFLCVGRVLYPTLGKQVRVAIFETVSALTTAGFSTAPYTEWTTLGVFVLILLMFIGGGTCSTAGGLKQYRVYLLCKSIVWEIKRAVLSKTAVLEHAIWQGERKLFVKAPQLNGMTAFVACYLLTAVFGTGVMLAYGYPLKEALFEYASTVGTVGLSIGGLTNPTTPPVILWTQILGMFLGRLEFFVIATSVIKVGQDLCLALRCGSAKKLPESARFS